MNATFYVSRVQSDELEGLENLFTTVGDVKSCHLAMIPDSGHQSEFGIFEMATEKQTSDCVERFNGYLYSAGRTLSLSMRLPVRRPPAPLPVKRKAANGRR